jgi:hypothetical protein
MPRAVVFFAVRAGFPSSMRIFGEKCGLKGLSLTASRRGARKLAGVSTGAAQRLVVDP